MSHVPGEASFEEKASDQDRFLARIRRRRARPFARGRRIRVRSSDHRCSASSEHDAQSPLRAQRRGNGRRQSGDIPPLRQGERHLRLRAVGARLRLRRLPWMWRMPWLWWWRIPWLRRWNWLRCPRLWLQRLWLRWVRRRWMRHWLPPRPDFRRLRRLRIRRVLRIVGRLPSVLIAGEALRVSTGQDFLAGDNPRGRPSQHVSCSPFRTRRPPDFSRKFRL
jgi:hypothetical protein